MASIDLTSRVALAVLLGLVALSGWPGRREVARALLRSGVVTVGVASAAVLAFEVDPDRFDWMKFGLPWWSRLIGLPLGIVALTVPKRPERAIPLFGVSCALLSASWIVALMTLRGWARSSFASPADLDRPPINERPSTASETAAG